MLAIGNQTSSWTASLTEPFDYALAQGFSAFEWFPDKKPGAGWDDTDLNSRTRQSILERAHSRGMRLSVHARWQADPFTPDGCALLWKDLDLARDLGAALLNIHLFHEQGLSRFVEGILPLVRRTAEAGLQLSIENTPHHSPDQFNDLFATLRALREVPVGHVGMCLDLGHANLCSATLNDYLKFFDRLDLRVPIIHLHLHENWGDTDSHLPLFTGPAARDDSGIRGLLDRLRERNYSGSAILEQWPHPPSLLNQARDRLLHLWTEKDEAPARLVGPEPARLNPSDKLKPTGGELVAELVSGNQRCRSWREKLDFVRGLLAREDPALTSDQLIDVAIYLRFLGTGEIACAEDGRHFRPAHHARIASEIYERLAQLTVSGNEFVVRKIHPWLPSSAPTFQRPEPLTRIRDIAHRNDIGSDLKREIKTTLQNKLHRCAGPEDLATSSALLERITAPGTTYPPAFVEQFKIFHDELKEFFNARSLEERLGALVPSVDGKGAELIRRFLQQKPSHTLDGRLAALQTLTELRQIFLGEAERRSGSSGQEFLLADIALDDLAFVLLSEIINGCEPSTSAVAMAGETNALILALKNLALSRIDRQESATLESEFRAWGTPGPSASRDELLRFRASVLRCRRLAENFGGRAAALFSGRVEKLGRALGVAEPAIRVFSESEIRSHVVFQVSKLAAGLLRRIRQGLGLPALDVIVGGRATGRVVMASVLGECNIGFPKPTLLLLKTAAGDEEIPRNVAGIVLAHEMPHLSHLGVRARQAGVVFVSCEDPDEFSRLQSLDGKTMSLVALPDKVVWESGEITNQLADVGSHRLLQLPAVRLRPEKPWVAFNQAVVETCGAKATGARRLYELSQSARAGFLTPAALVVPFGVMEAALAGAPGGTREYDELVRQLDGLPLTEFEGATRRLRGLLKRLAVPGAIVSQVQRQFGQNTALIVRSSANGEDLEEFAGAGLYESVINVSPSDVGGAICSVWSSLWTERAALSRRRLGIPHRQVHMAVLVQELINPDLSFVLHTVNPITHDAREVYAEVVVGLGETLVSGTTPGSPYRLTGDKQSGAVTTLGFANFSQARRPATGGGLEWETVDYSRVELSRDAGAREQLGRVLSEMGAFVEQALGKPQDIEGAVVKDKIYLVQARAQQGLQEGKVV